MRLLPIGLGLLLASSLSGQRPADAPANADDVTLRDGAKSVLMKSIEPTRSGRLGLPSSKQYFIFSGPRAALRVSNPTPVFEFYADPNRVASDVYLFKFETRSDRREIRVAKGAGGFGVFKIPKDRIVPTSLEEIGAGPDSTKRYRMKPSVPLRPGEYCLAQSSISYYDFGVD
ncbi:MAG: hypothetical protein AABM67_20080 [Acidobacteriota bacterium]